MRRLDESELGRARAPEGAELVLYERAGVFSLRSDGLELMCSRTHLSEDLLATMGLARVRASNPCRVLIGGLGFGFTVRAALAELPSWARVRVAEISESVVDWNRGPLAALWPEGEDERMSVEVTDVRACLRGGPFEAILLDVDNGPSPLVREANAELYSVEGLKELAGALSLGGTLAVWSAFGDEAFGARMRAAGLVSEARAVSLGRVEHVLFLGHVEGAVAPCG
ncbi:MAG: spermidine synthase [Deltaproteobacteria bacterium]|nr:spermidine synthase [Deltaproteobacteria bacterium]